jgi:hypothetical protein
VRKPPDTERRGHTGPGVTITLIPAAATPKDGSHGT